MLVQLAVPSRQDVEEYQNLRSTVNELVGRINGRFGTVEFMPIHFMHKSLAFDELCALYAVSDVCLVTSTRDGMNLVCLSMLRLDLQILTNSSGVLRVRRLSTSTPRCHDLVRVCRCRTKSQWVTCCKPLGFTASC